MVPVKTACVPQFGSLLSSSQRDEPDLDHTEPSHQSQTDKRRKKRSKSRAKKTTGTLLKVKLPGLNNPRSQGKVTKATRPKVILAPTGSNTEKPPNQQTPTHCTAAPCLVDGDVYFFSEKPTRTSEKEKTKLMVLRTISKMLEENRLIRERLSNLRHVPYIYTGCTPGDKTDSDDDERELCMFDGDLVQLFNSDTEDEDFDGFVGEN